MDALRPLRESDIKAVVSVYRRAWGDARPIDEGDLALWLRDPDVDLQNLRVLEVAGSVVAYGDLTVANGVVALEVAAPGYWDVFLDWAEATARDAGAHRVRTLSYREPSELAEVAARRGYFLWRSSFTMRTDFGCQPPELSPAPSGFDLRPYRKEDVTRILPALNSIFESDPFFVRMTPGQFELSYLHDPGMDPMLWIIAWDAMSEIAGFALGFSEWHGDDGIGEVRSVGVLPKWRSRGLGEAVVRRTLSQLHAHGLQSAVLGVDASNETHALRLYERVGMDVVARHDNWALDLSHA